MKEVQYYKEIGLIDDDLIAEAAISGKNTTSRRMRIKWGAVACAACLTVSVLFGTAYAVSAEFREFIISFFKSEQIETPIVTPESKTPAEPNESESQEHFIGQQKIDNVAQISYFQFDGDFEIYDNTIAMLTEDGRYKIYKRDDNDFTEMPQYRIEDTIHVNGLELPLSFVYVIDSGMIKTFDNVYEPESGGQAVAIWSAEGDFVWVNLSIRRELNTYVCYDLKTGTVRDVISEAGVETGADTQISLSPDNKTILVHDYHTAYLVDAEKATARELSSLNTSDELSVSFIDNETLSVWQRPDGNDVRYTVFSYNIGTDEKTTVFENMPYCSLDSSTGIRGLGKGITVLVEPEQYVLVDEKSGVRYAVEELKPDLGIDFLLSPDRKRVSVVTMSGQNGLGITQIGYINIEKQELKIFDRQDFSENHETSLYWLNENELAVTANNDMRYLYVYRFD